MNNNPLASHVQAHPASVDAYIRQGWYIVPMPRGSKGPNHANWNRKENCLNQSAVGSATLPHDSNYGLAHAYSGTMALDVDNWDLAKAELAKHGIDLDALYNAPDAVTIESGRDGHGKLIYAMPFGLVLPSKKRITEINGVKTNYLDFRCATANGLTVQDVLPSSIHPETQQPYRWGGRGHWSRLPVIPQPLLDLWTGYLEQDTERTIPTGDIDASWDEIQTALTFISPDIDRTAWVNVGMALHYAGTVTGQLEQAFDLWNQWSAGSVQDKYKGTRDLWSAWKSFSPDGGITLGTLFNLAKDGGWRRPVPSAEEIFGVAPTHTQQVVDATMGNRAPIPRIDLNQFPKILAQRAEELSQSVGCDPLVPLFAGLAVASGVADARIKLELMPGFEVPPVLWVMTVGKPADKKTPGSKPMTTVIREIEAEDRPRYRKEKLEWDAQEAIYSAAHKAYLEHYASAEGQLANDAAPIVPELPPAPVPLRITVDDITSQKLVRHGAERPRGVLCWMDEMAGWVNRVTDKRSGDDRSTWTKGYESSWYEYDRVTAGSIWCDNFAVSIYGNMQPAVFRRNAKNLGEDGLIQRFIPGILDSKMSRVNYPIPDAFSCRQQWDQTIRTIYTLPVMTYRLSPEAYEVYRAFQHWYHESKLEEVLLDSGDETQDGFMTAFGKLEGQCGRLALVLHLIEMPWATEVSGDLMQRTVNIVKGYLVPSLRYLLGEVSGLLEDSLEAWVTKFILQMAGEMETVTLRDIKRGARRKLDALNGMQENHKTNLILDCMDFLQQCQWVALTESLPTRNHYVWTINPALAEQFKEQRDAILKAKQRRMDYTMENIREFSGKEYPRKLVRGYDESLDNPEED